MSNIKVSFDKGKACLYSANDLIGLGQKKDFMRFLLKLKVKLNDC